MRIYAKHGRLSYKERRLLDAIEKAIDKKRLTEPDFTVDTAFNEFELQHLHDRLCVIDVEYKEVPPDAGDANESQQLKDHRNFRDRLSPESQEETVSQNSPMSTKAIDPLNAQGPIVRDYVLNEEISRNENASSEDGVKTDFAEPTTFSESFEIPDSSQEQKTNLGGGGDKGGGKKPPTEGGARSFNPQFDEMSSGRKKRTTKRMAKLIVEAVIMLAEKGCIWWSTKDITEDKLIQYELDGEMDLSLLISLENDQQATIREWFVSQRLSAEQLFKVDEEDKNDLIESLTEVMMEKGIAPTPTQELIINAVKTFVLDMGIKALALQSQIKAVLTELRARNAGYTTNAKQPSQSQSASSTTDENSASHEVEEDYTQQKSGGANNEAVGSFEEQDIANELISEAVIVADGEQ